MVDKETKSNKDFAALTWVQQCKEAISDKVVTALTWVQQHKRGLRSPNKEANRATNKQINNGEYEGTLVSPNKQAEGPTGKQINNKGQTNIANRIQLEDTKAWGNMQDTMLAYKDLFQKMIIPLTKSVMIRDNFQWKLFERQHKAVMVAMLPVLKLNMQCSNKKWLHKLYKHIEVASKEWMTKPRTVWGNTPVIYARINLINSEVYIGKTTSFNTRFQCHTRKVLKHYTGKCKKCGDHHSYTRQGLIHPGEWVMMPLAFTNILSLDQCEKFYITKMQSKLNKEIWGKGRRWNHVHRRQEERPKAKGRRRRPRQAAAIHNNITVEKTQYMVAQEGTICSQSLNTVIQEASKIYLKQYNVTFTRHKDTDTTDWTLLKWKYGMITIQMGETGEVGKLHEMVGTLKQQTIGGFEIMDWDTEGKAITTNSIENLLKMMSKKKCQLKKFYNMSADHHVKLWQHMKLIEEKGKQQLIRTRLRMIICKAYGFNPFRKIKLTVPYATKIRTGRLRKALFEHIKPITDSLPKAILTWIQSNIEIKTCKRADIAKILVNFSHFAKAKQTQCCCKQLRHRMERYGCKLPEINGHIAFTGDQYTGPGKHILMQNCDNQPIPNGNRDIKMIQESIDEALDKLPKKWRMQLTKHGKQHFTNTKGLIGICETTHTNNSCANTEEVWKMRKDFKGACISKLDRNAGKLHVCCPIVYNRAMRKVFNLEESESYEKLQIKTFTQFQVQHSDTNKGKLSEQYKYKNKDTEGTEQDLIDIWEWHYNKSGWAKIAPFNRKGKLGNAYVMFKHKYWKELDHPKQMKARPVNPMCAHPMWQLFNAVGRAWMFIVNQWETEHHILRDAMNVPNIIKQAKINFGGDNVEYEHHIWDVDSCYPSMPREDILKAMGDILLEVRSTDRKEKRKFILVPRTKLEKPRWGTSYTEEEKVTHMKIDFKVMQEVMDFSMDNAICKLGGTMIRQIKGIPQGDSLSPAICIGTLAWYENKWMSKQSKEDKKNMVIKRYLDDVIMIINSQYKNKQQMINTYKQQCFPKGLSLEGEKGDCNYLETMIINDGHNIECKHRNKNGGKIYQEFYRGKHAWSYSEEKHKIGAMIGTFLRIERNSSQTQLAIISMKEKYNELKGLKYTKEQMKRVTKYLACKHTTSPLWHFCNTQSQFMGLD